jgi:hypothetical protein
LKSCHAHIPYLGDYGDHYADVRYCSNDSLSVEISHDTDGLGLSNDAGGSVVILTFDNVFLTWLDSQDSYYKVVLDCHKVFLTWSDSQDSYCKVVLDCHKRMVLGDFVETVNHSSGHGGCVLTWVTLFLTWEDSHYKDVLNCHRRMVSGYCVATVSHSSDHGCCIQWATWCKSYLDHIGEDISKMRCKTFDHHVVEGIAGHY